MYIRGKRRNPVAQRRLDSQPDIYGKENETVEHAPAFRNRQLNVSFTVVISDMPYVPQPNL